LRDLCATLNDHVLRVELCIDAHLHRDVKGCRVSQGQPLVEMLIFDEAERLSMTALECIRAMFDRTGVGVILIGMPGMGNACPAIRNSTAAAAAPTTTAPCRTTCMRRRGFCISWRRRDISLRMRC
jgi:AAA domain